MSSPTRICCREGEVDLAIMVAQLQKGEFKLNAMRRMK